MNGTAPDTVAQEIATGDGRAASPRSGGGRRRWPWIVATVAAIGIGLLAGVRAVGATTPILFSYGAHSSTLSGLRITPPYGDDVDVYAYEPGADLGLTLGFVNDGPFELEVTAVELPYQPADCGWRLEPQQMVVKDPQLEVTDAPPVLPPGGELHLAVPGRMLPGDCFSAADREQITYTFAAVKVRYEVLGLARETEVGLFSRLIVVDHDQLDELRAWEYVRELRPNAPLPSGLRPDR